MALKFRPVRDAADLRFIHELIISEVANGHFDPALLDPRASVGLMRTLQNAAQYKTRTDEHNNVVPAQITVADIGGDPVGFMVTTLLVQKSAKLNEFWLGGVDPARRKQGIMSQLVAFLCAQLDQAKLPVVARLLPASADMRRILLGQGFVVPQTLPDGRALMLRKGAKSAAPVLQ